MATRLTIIGLLLTGAMAVPAAAHETPRGPQARVSGLLAPLAPDGTNGSSLNMSLVANLPQAGPAGDVAFWENTAVVSHGSEDGDPNNDGFRLVDISVPSRPRVIGGFTCPSSGFDVGVWDDLVFLSVGKPGSATCRAGETDFQGIVIVSIANPRRPRYLAAVPTCDSHTNTVVPDLERGRVIVFSTGFCTKIVEVPLRHPTRARVAGELPVVSSIDAPGCHDVTVLLEHALAGAACAHNGVQLFDISDPVAPERVGTFTAPIAHHHSVVFSPDGKLLALSEEQLEGIVPGVCYGGTLSPRGALWFYDISDRTQPELKSYLQISHARPAGYCSAHQASLVPTTDERNLLTIGWYRGGAVVVDFTDPAAPRQVAHFTADDPGSEQDSNAWSAYFYRGHVYVTNVDGRGSVNGAEFAHPSRRGLDVLAVEETLFGETRDLPHLNAQTQE